MANLIVDGGYPLDGCCRICGAKNAVLPILAASLMTTRPVRLYDCPALTDVRNMADILKTLGCKILHNGNVMDIDASGVNGYELPEHLSKELRSSIFMLGSVLGRFGQAVATYPGGCEIGNRPIDLHLKGLSALGVHIQEEGGRIYCDGHSLTGADIHLDYPSVGATENIMMAAVSAKGETVIRNAAREPEIIDLQRFLTAAGFWVHGAGSSTIIIAGGYRPRDVTFTIMPDRIVAGTLLVAAAISRGTVTLENVVAEHLSGTVSKLTEAGCAIRFPDEDTVLLKAPLRPKELKLVETLPHPGFPTDMQAQIFALCSVAEGTSMIVENVFENRFKHAQELMRMGADNTIKGRTAVIRGVQRLTGAKVTAWDLRGGAALVLAGLAAEGYTVVSDAAHIDRGYERLETMLSALGAHITREN